MKSVRRVTAIAFLMVMTVIPASPGVASGHVFISELHYDNSGADTGEFVEVQGTFDTDLDGWSVVLYNGSNGEVYNTIDLTGVIDDESGGEGALAFFQSGIQNGAPDGLALVDPSDSVIEFLSYEGEFEAVDGPAQGMTSVDIGVSEPGSTPIGESLQKIDDAWVGPQPESPGDLNQAAGPPPGPIEVKIHEVQGSGFTSPLVGERVVVEGIVVGDFETFDQLAGFFVQEEDADADADPDTSEGVFVFNFSNDNVSVGDLVTVEGTVDERFGNTQLTDFVEVDVVSSGNDLPTAAGVSFPLVSTSDLEAVEGMHATFPQTLSILEYFNYDRFGEVVVGLPMDGQDRLHQPTAVFDPGSPGSFELADYNSSVQITIDDGRTNQNPDPAIHPGNGEVFDLDNRFRGGDTIEGITGAIYFDFGRYRIMPTEYGDYQRANPRPDAPDEVGGDLKVAAFNALNYFLTIDDGVNDICGPDRDLECRGADNENERLRQRDKLLAAIERFDADVVGLIEVENTPGVEPLADLVDGLNVRLGRNTYRYVAAGEDSVVGTDAIKVGLIYKPANVQPIGETAILDDPSFLDPNDLGEDKNRAAVAQTFVEKGTGERFTVVVNHLKSKGSPCGPGDDDPQAGSCNLTRTLAAEALLDWLDTTPTDVDDPDVLIVGDLNSYDKEDPIDVLLAAGYADLLLDYQGEFAYSFLFSAQLGYLDYGMASPSLVSQVTGATAWHINADEPDILDYDTTFKRDAQDALYEPNAFRSSDHDPVLIGLDLASKPGRGLGRG